VRGIRCCIEVSGLPEAELKACLDEFDAMVRRDQEVDEFADALVSAFGCISGGIIQDCADIDDMYTPGEIFDVIMDVRNKDGGDLNV
jgi:hypothetical protein